MTARKTRPVAALLLFAAALLAAGALAGAAARNETVLETTIVSADIYGGLARVTRRGRVALTPGTWRIVCDDLPNAADETSLQVAGAGTAGAVILGTDIERIVEPPEETPRYGELRARRDALQGRRDSLAVVVTALANRSSFLKMLAALPTKQGEEQHPPDIFRVDDWRALMDFLQADETATWHAAHDVKKRVDEIDRTIAAIDAELGSMKRESWRRRLVVSCEASSPGTLSLDVTYSVGPVSWIPRYTIRYDAATERIGLDYRARINQKTGEDWRDVAVTLSTAKPHIGAAPPDVRPFYVRRLRPLPRGGRGGLQEIVVEAEAVNDVAEAVAMKSAVVSADAVATVAMSQFAASFALPGTVDLPSGDAPKTVLATHAILAGALARSTAPRLSRHVFITAEAENTLGVPILDGQAEVYVETPAPGRTGTVSTFVGRADVAAVPAGGTFPVHLGADQDIAVSFELVKREQVSPDSRSRRAIRFTYEIGIESFKQEPVEVTVRDRVPVSAEKDIRIGDVDLDPRPNERDEETGLCSWTLLLQPKEKRLIGIAYTISVPAEWPEHLVPME
ncbi:MAG: mucoidy inhibitor MuiA family protein [Candidatus Krumholzibacteriota bacterium]|nr:mucoidy inhibitor MuiA family protein [Candidatus Krumholzibacteriota bacterium]